MKLSSQKVIAGLIGVATILTLVVGIVTPAAAQVTTTTSSTSSTFTRNLTIGSTGADVTALQQWLATKGFFTVTPTGYFGPITQKALAAFQASVGISPAAGYFGPITMAYLANNGGTTTTTTTTTSSVPGCAAGAMYSATTGAPCTSTSSVPGCAAGALFSATTGAPCTAGNTTLPAGCVAGSAFSSTTGVACTPTSVSGNGVLTVTQDPSVVTNTNITNYTNVPIYGVQLQAQLGSVNVSQLTLGITDEQYPNTTTYENPGAFITSISVVDPSTNTTIYTEPVTPASFIVNPVTSNTFYVQLSGFNFNVPVNSTKDLVVEVSVSPSIDIGRQLIVTGYPSLGNSLQYFTGNNIVNYQTLPWNVTSTFTTSNTTNVVFGVDSSNPTAGTDYINSTSGAQGVILLAFNAQSSSGTVNLSNLTATFGASSTAPTAVYLYNGSTLLSAVSTTAGSTTQIVTFNNFTDPVTSGTTKVFTLRADFPSNTATGTVASTTLNTVSYTTSGGQIQTQSSINISGNTQTFYSASSNFKILNVVTPVETAGVQGVSSSTLAVTFPVSVTPEPGQEQQPSATDFKVWVGTSLTSGSYVTPWISTPISPTPSSGTAPLSQGTTYTFSLSAQAPTTLARGVAYTFWLTNASTTVSNSTGGTVTQQYGTTTIPNNQSGAATYN